MRVLPEEISIWISSLSKEICCHPMWVGIFQFVEGPNRTKMQKKKKKNKLFFSWTGYPFIFPALEHQSSWILGLQTLGLVPAAISFSGLWPQIGSYTINSPGSQVFDWDWIIPLAVLALQFADRRLWDFSASITMRANSYNKSPFESEVNELVTQSCATLPPHRLACQAPQSWDFPGKNTGVGCHFLLQGISRPRDWIQVSCIGTWILYHRDTREAYLYLHI